MLCEFCNIETLMTARDNKDGIHNCCPNCRDCSQNQPLVSRKDGKKYKELTIHMVYKGDK